MSPVREIYLKTCTNTPEIEFWHSKEELADTDINMSGSSDVNLCIHEVVYDEYYTHIDT